MDPQTSRRKLLLLAVDRVATLTDELRGRPSLNLSELETLEDGEIASLVLTHLYQSKISVRDEHLLGAPSADAQPVPLFRIDTRDEDVWCNIDGCRSLRKIANHLAEQWNETATTAFAVVRRISTEFMHRGVCVPINPPDVS